MKIKYLQIVFLLVFTNSLWGQEYGTGLLMADEFFENNAQSAPLMRGDYNNLSKSISLKKYAPTPGNQGRYGTCSGWSTAYAGRTILESLKFNWTGSIIDSNVFSPSYVYNQIRKTKNCYGGASIIDALDILKTRGGIKLKNFEYTCDRTVAESDHNNAKEYTIIEYREVANRTTKVKTKRVKKSLSEMKPVIIAMYCPNSFSGAKDLWQPREIDYKENTYGHAVCIVGYDDNKFGGAFNILNSWGTNWGKGGYTWMKYEDFEHFCIFAFELISKEFDEMRKYDLSGSLKFITANEEPMRVSFDGKLFNMEDSFESGSLFQLFISNNQPAYVYAFGTDLTNVTYKIFPFHDKMLAYLPYKENNIAIPDEGSYTMLDEIAGTTYYVFLYSKEKLDIDGILSAYEKLDKTIVEKLNFILGNKTVEIKNLIFTDGETISFKAKSGVKSIVALVVKIDHK
ncbi:MAG: cysteine protease [Ignavibacteriae bacterium]|nr:cysteine protease [Ignavibacteriota bacterium]